MTVFILHLSSPVGRYVVKGRNVVRCTGWRTATCGAPPAAGKRPARDSPTKRLQANITAHQRAAAFRQSAGGGASFCMHLVFLSSKSQLFVKLWLCPCRCSSPLNSTEPFQLWKEPKDSGLTFYIADQDSQYCLAILIIPSLGNPSAAK